MTEDILSALQSDSSPETAARFVDLIADYLARAAAGSGSVSTSRSAADLASRFAEPLPRGGHALADVTARIASDVIRDANRLAHPMCMGHQVSAPLPVAIWTDAVASALNQSLAVNEMSPTLTALETQLIRWMCDLAGFGDAAGGSITSGGTEATFTALLAARARAMPNAWADGVGAAPPVVISGEHAHYAVSRALGELGLGTQRSSVIVPSRDWRMDVDALARALDAHAARGVMAVVATAGSTATGSFDDLDAIGRLCAERDVWLHVDGAHGASALLSARHGWRVRGIERAHSVAWDPHKMMLLPLSAGMLLVRDERDLERAFAQQAPYLFHDAVERPSEKGTRSFLCSRRADALKVWVALQRYGADGLGALYDHLCDVARALHDAVRDSADFVALHEPECNIFCFRWVGGRRRDAAELDELNREMRERYNASGRGWITTTIVDGRRVLRVTVMNPRTTAEHALAMLNGLREVAKEL